MTALRRTKLLRKIRRKQSVKEETVFVNLVNKLRAMNFKVSDAKNIHKTVKDNLFLYYTIPRDQRIYNFH